MKCDWEISLLALKLVSQTEMCDPKELKEHIASIESEIGNGYYDGAGDALLQQIVDHLRSRLS